MADQSSTTPDKLLDLAVRVEGLQGPDRLTDEAIRALVFPTSVDGMTSLFTASIDAAMQLVPEGWQLDQLGEWCDATLRAKGKWFAILIEPQRPLNDGGSGGGGDPYSRCQHAATPALALTAACLRARATGEPQ